MQAPVEAKTSTSFVRRLFSWRYFSATLSGIAIASGLLTYLAISYGKISFADRSALVGPFIAVDALIIALLSWVIGFRIRDVYREHKRGEMGARLHVTILGTFATVTVAPSFLMGILAMAFFKSSVSVWFGKPVQDTIRNANLVADLYLAEHRRSITVDASELAYHLKLFLTEHDFLNPDNLPLVQEELDRLVEEQKLEEAMVVVRGQGKEMEVFSTLAFSLPFIQKQFMLSEENVGILDASDAPIFLPDLDTARAVVRFESPLHDANLDVWVSKDIDPNIVQYVTQARDSTNYYNVLFNDQQKFQFTIMVLFVMSSLLLLLGALWMGLSLSNVLIEPILRLIAAADRVSKGDLETRIVEDSGKNELSQLVRSFNHMVERLERQNHDLIISEKKSAWADIARKIAHEVKNPLTPIQLSAERLKRKYSMEIRSDPETFTKCIDTIIRQVSHIERLISEFSSFARMPEPTLQETNLNQLVQDVVFMHRQASPLITFQVDLARNLSTWFLDPHQIHQVLLNLVQNSVNAITESDNRPKGVITLTLRKVQDWLQIVVEDNGPGFPSEHRERLFEPYFTTRSKGTGLGMAIVLRIITEHNGRLDLRDAVGHRGARVEILLPPNQAAPQERS